MRSVLPFVLLIFLISCKAEKKKKEDTGFEGVVTFKTSVYSKDPRVSNEELRALHGDTMRYFMKNGNYRIEVNSRQMKAMYYHQKSNTLYTLWQGADTFEVTDCGNNSSPIIAQRILPDDTLILGRHCRCYEALMTDAHKIVCYDTSLYVDPGLFHRHHYDNVAAYYSVSQAMFLAYMFETTLYAIRYDAVRVEEREVDEEEIVLRLPGK